MANDPYAPPDQEASSSGSRHSKQRAVKAPLTVKADRIGVDASTMEANAALRTIVRRDSGEIYREMLKRMAEESGIETPSADDLIRMDRARSLDALRTLNKDWRRLVEETCQALKKIAPVV